jgi:hypothetical protein
MKIKERSVVLKTINDRVKEININISLRREKTNVLSAAFTV